MIKKMYNLTTNELTKLLIKPSIIVVIAIIFISSILIPIIPKVFMSHASGLTSEIYQFQLGAATGELKNLDTKKDSGKAKAAFLKSQEAQVKLLIDSKVEEAGWRSTEASKYLEVLYKIDAINLLKENISSATISASIPAGTISLDPSVLKLPTSEYAAALKKLNTEKTTLYNNIKENNYIEHFTKEITNTKAQIKTLEAELVPLNKKFKKEPTSLTLEDKIRSIYINISALKSIIKIDQYRVDHKIPFSMTNWKSATLSNLATIIPSSQNPMVTKTQFLSNPHGRVTYEQYVAKFKHDQTTFNNQIKADWYSLEHNIPQTQFQSSSSRDITNSFISLYAIVAIIFMIILAGGVVSVEFSKETIKLLLIRPVSRFKVLLSKLIAVYIVGYAVLFGSMILVTISSGVLFGFGDYLTPVIKVSSGIVESHNYFGVLILAILYLSLSLLLFGAFAFMLSAVTKSTAVSVASSIIIFIGAPIVTIILFTKSLIFFDITPLPYLNLPFVGVIRAFSQSKAILNNTLGGIEIVILAIILAIIGFVVFIKSDVNR
ncbi:ABC transporter permease [uncultured Clostridium sp.]|uniref:ABC transporter permease n=1 Tax=uncultured Clostridium sp. TaxID=59620 RepID=UPI00263879D2|nr:ABC transporter permease subunit [uncultured Clostridium sp.]